jgi:hypothetical protein
MRHTAGKTVAMYFGQPVVNLREFLPDEAIRLIKMGDGEAPVVPEFKHLGSMLSKNFDESVLVTIMARIRLVRIAFTKLQKAFSGRGALRSARLESKNIAYESLVLSLLLYGSECWGVTAENTRPLQRFHRRCIRIMCRVVTRHHRDTRKHHISTKELEAKHQALCSLEGAEIPRPRLSYGCRPDSISPAALLDSGWQAAPSSAPVGGRRPPALPGRR